MLQWSSFLQEKWMFLVDRECDRDCFYQTKIFLVDRYQ